jgi:NTE family protein
MTSSQHPHLAGNALVLGGGGATGNAWLIGVIAGLYDGGVDVTTADLVVGTSAGSTAAAQLSRTRPPQLLADILTAPAPPPGGSRAAMGGIPVVNHLERTQAIIEAASDPADLRRRLGASVLDLDPDAAGSARWRATVASRFPGTAWPAHRLLITAIDARTGEPVVFDRDSGIDLVDAVAASTSGGFSYGIGERRFLDGGYRSNADNADLAAGSARILVLSPFGGRARIPEEWGMHLADQVAALRADGSEVVTVFPHEGMPVGAQATDPTLRPIVARDGFEQGRGLAAEIGPFWNPEGGGAA